MISSEHCIEVRRELIGVIPDNATIIVTPIRSIFRAFHDRGLKVAEHGGWWPRLTSPDGSVHAVHIPQGGGVADLVLTLAPATKVLLVGYTGALVPSLGVGEVFRPQTAQFVGGQSYLVNGHDNTSVSGSVMTVSHMLESYGLARDGATAADAADLECAHAARARHLTGGCPISVYLIVTDRWPDRPFYRTGDAARQRISASVRGITDLLVNPQY